MLPFDDMYIPTILDYEFEDLVNEFFILKDDDADNYSKELSSYGVSFWFGNTQDNDLVAIVVGGKQKR